VVRESEIWLRVRVMRLPPVHYSMRGNVSRGEGERGEETTEAAARPLASTWRKEGGEATGAVVD
jgi:hypothetical protein